MHTCQQILMNTRNGSHPCGAKLARKITKTCDHVSSTPCRPRAFLIALSLYEIPTTKARGEEQCPTGDSFMMVMILQAHRAVILVSLLLCYLRDVPSSRIRVAINIHNDVWGEVSPQDNENLQPRKFYTLPPPSLPNCSFSLQDLDNQGLGGGTVPNWGFLHDLPSPSGRQTCKPATVSSATYQAHASE